MRDRSRLALTLAAITVAYVLAGRLGLQFAFVNEHVTAVWPPAGIAVAALLVYGVRVWPAVAIGAFITNLISMHAIAPSLAIAVGNTLEAVLATMLTVRYANGRQVFDRGPDILRFAAFGALLSTVVAATVGAITLQAWAFAPTTDVWTIWLTWWIGDATGIVLFTPVVVLWSLHRHPIGVGRPEALLLLAALAAVLYAVFGVRASLQQDLPLAVLMVPLLSWSAFRFDPRTTATLGIIMSAIAVYRILQQLGPFSLGAPAISLLVVQFVVALVSLLMLSVAAENRVRRRVESEMRLLNETLEQRVTDRTAELTRVHDRLLEAQAVAHIGSWEWDVVADAVWWSDELCRIFGVRAMPRDYREYLALVHPDDRGRVDLEVGRSIRTRAPFSFDHRIVRPDGSQRVIHSRGRLEVDDAGNLTRLVGAGLDITERTQAEAARAQLIDEQVKLREAEAANRAKDAFLATLSHELRTPLNAALGWAHVLRDSLRASGRDDRAVQAIYRNLLIQWRLVSDILDISQITRGQLPLEYEQVDLVAVFGVALDLLHDEVSTKGVSVEISHTGTPAIAGDNRRLQQVAWNLLSNAVKFAADGGRVTVSIVGSADAVECCVEDDGPGIAPAFLPHVFEQFRQEDPSATRAYGGLGLGLAIVREIVSMHRGTITAANRPSGGAAFVVRLPRDETLSGLRPSTQIVDHRAGVAPAPDPLKG